MEAIFRTLRDAGECRSARYFSVNWLAKSPNYFAQLRYGGSAPDRCAIVLLEHLIWERHHQLGPVQDHRVQAARVKMVYAAMLAADLAEWLNPASAYAPDDDDED